jgi:hypothetical protein
MELLSTASQLGTHMHTRAHTRAHTHTPNLQQAIPEAAHSMLLAILSDKYRPKNRPSALLQKVTSVQK